MHGARTQSHRKAWQCIMGGCNSKPNKREKGKIKQGGNPSKGARTVENPDSIMQLHPVWKFAACDMDPACRWSFHKDRLQDDIWNIILPKLIAFESMTLSAIFVQNKKHNHSNSVDEMTKDARDRLAELEIEADALQSLTLGGTRRIYGFLDKAIFNIVWYDDDHGDNPTCVYRSHKKHT